MTRQSPRTVGFGVRVTGHAGAQEPAGGAVCSIGANLGSLYLLDECFVFLEKPLCSIGANLGSLYLLDECFVFLEKPALIFMYEKCFVFLEKPARIFMYEKVSEIVFERQKNRVDAAQSKTFDFKIKMTDGKSQEFNLIPKKELKNLERFFTAISAGKFDKKKMRIANYNEDEEETQHVNLRIVGQSE
ncbi:hypothetical protein T484DRAFT_1794102 [Baffinella frigidus]|nr:hypothetical protein T484DRAFT_1794102 [Cryptophyta sp. CCMP2293]